MIKEQRTNKMKENNETRREDSGEQQRKKVLEDAWDEVTPIVSCLNVRI